MKTKEELIDLKNLYSKRVETARNNFYKFKGKAGEEEWFIQFHMARGKVELLRYLLEEK